MDDRILENINANHRDLVGRVDDVMKVLREHMDAPGHAGQAERLKALEEEVHTQKGRPIQAWQIISGVIALFISLIYLFLSFLSDTIAIIAFIRTFH